MTQSWPRDHEWKRWLPHGEFVAVAEVAEQLTKGYGSASFSATTKLRQPRSSIRSDSREELAAVIASRSADEIEEVDWRITEIDLRHPLSPVISIWLRMERWTGSGRTALHINGVDRTAVEGIFVQLREHIDRAVERLEAAERAEAEREAAERSKAEQAVAQRQPATALPGDHEPPGFVARLWESKLIVRVVLPIVVSVLAGAILIAIFGPPG